MRLARRRPAADLRHVAVARRGRVREQRRAREIGFEHHDVDPSRDHNGRDHDRDHDDEARRGRRPPRHRPTAPPSTAAPTTAPPPPPTTAAAAPLLVTQLAGIGSAGQVIAVDASGYGTSVATFTAYQRGPSGWTQMFGPWEADIGRNGVAPAGAKREGDGRTPSGVFGFDFMFGVYSDPGVHFPFRRITGPNIVWDDDPASPNYNEWIDTNTAPAGASNPSRWT